MTFRVLIDTLKNLIKNNGGQSLKYTKLSRVELTSQIYQRLLIYIFAKVFITYIGTYRFSTCHLLV